MEQRLINKIVHAMEIEVGDIVLLNFWGSEEEIEDLYAFASAVAEVGAYPQMLHHSLKYYAQMFSSLSCEFSEKWFKQFKEVDVVIDIMNRAPGQVPEGLEDISIYRSYIRELFKCFSEKKKLIQITMPTKENAKNADMNFDLFYERTVKALDIDYKELKGKCQERIENFNGQIRTIHTGNDCVLTLDTTGREWIVDAGDGALPCGEIYIAPIEENTNGTVFFELFSVDGLGVFNDITIEVENGRIIKTNCDEFNSFIRTLPDGADIIAELGIGMNPNVEKILGDSHLDENAIGTFHIALGMNYLFGGKNKCPVHIDLVGEGVVK
mgnify:FL=1